MYVYTHGILYIYVFTHIYMYTQMYVHAYMYTCVYMCVYIYFVRVVDEVGDISTAHKWSSSLGRSLLCPINIEHDAKK